jgi:hypothetical protein
MAGSRQAMGPQPPTGYLLVRTPCGFAQGRPSIRARIGLIQIKPIRGCHRYNLPCRKRIVMSATIFGGIVQTGAHIGSMKIA